LKTMHGFHMRPVEMADRGLLFDWANDPLVRKMSFATGRIGWEEHCRWFEDKLNDPRAFLFIAENEPGQAHGLVRFDIDGGTGTISIVVAPGARGRGYGSRIITDGCSEIFQLVPGIETILAHIKVGNVASMRAFRRAGFRDSESSDERGSQRVLMCFEKGKTHAG